MGWEGGAKIAALTAPSTNSSFFSEFLSEPGYSGLSNTGSLPFSTPPCDLGPHFFFSFQSKCEAGLEKL